MFKKLLLLGAAYFLWSGITQAQDNRCATMDLLEQQIKENPARGIQFEQAEKNLQQFILAYPGGIAQALKQHQNLTPIPGFTPTGDIASDLMQYKSAKAVLFADQVSYRKLLDENIDHAAVNTNMNKRDQYSSFQIKE